MMTQTEALDKVRKLLRLSESNNPHEAALAASRAQEIIERFKIEKFALEYDDASAARETAAEPIQNFGFDPLDEEGGATWKGRLASSISRLNQCKVYRSSGRLCLIGRPSDVGTARYLYAWIAREIDRLARKHCAGCGRTYANNFRIGATEMIARRLAEQHVATVASVKQESAGNAFALVRVESALATTEKRMAEVRAWTKTNLRLRAGSRSSARFDSGAREAGRRAGNSISLRPAAGSLGSGTH